MSSVVIVSGLGRCGSSLVMQMLAAAGLRCAGSFPSFEDMAVAPSLDYLCPPVKDRMKVDVDLATPGPSREWFDDYQAVKILGAHRVNLSRCYPLEACVIWIDRTSIEQAKSQLKVNRRQNPRFLVEHPDKKVLDTFRAVLASERKMAVEALIPAPRIEMRFEDIIRFPVSSAERIRDFVKAHGHHNLDAKAMASAVVARPVECADGFTLERSLGAEPGLGN